MHKPISAAFAAPADAIEEQGEPGCKLLPGATALPRVMPPSQGDDIRIIVMHIDRAITREAARGLPGNHATPLRRTLHRRKATLTGSAALAGPIRQQGEPRAESLSASAAAPAVVPPGEDDNIQISITDADDEAEREGARQAARPLVDDTEQYILTVMEFSGLGRAAAIDLLAEFNGSPEAALANIYG